ncbi:MAG: ABC transporter substrate-binding protein [Clostridium sp.]
MLKKLLIIATLSVGSMALLVGCGNSEVVVEKKPELKIVSTTVAPSQVADRLELNLVGIPTTKSKLPERYAGITEVGSAMTPNIETIVSLSPDLVIIDNNFRDKYESQLNDKNIKGLYFDTSTVNGFKNSIKEFGDITGESKKANDLIKEIEKNVNDELAKSKKVEKKPSVAILFGTSQSSMLATDMSYVGDLINQIGADNITDKITGVDSAYVNFSLEEVVNLNPDYILRLTHGDLEQAKKDFDKMFVENPAWSSLDATKNGKVIDLDSTIFGVSANIRVGEAINKLGQFIYGE